jgi:hypothetical protein
MLPGGRFAEGDMRSSGKALAGGSRCSSAQFADWEAGNFGSDSPSLADTVGVDIRAEQERIL